MNSTKKILAAVAALSMAIMAVPQADAANIPAANIEVNGSATASIATTTDITTVAFTPTTALVDGDTIILYYDENITDAGLVLGDITPSNAGNANTYGAVVVDTASNSVTVPLTTVDGGNTGLEQITLTFANSHFVTPGAGEMLTFTVQTDDDLGSNLIPVDSYNQITVTANVLPILSMTVANSGSVALGDLTPDSAKTTGTLTDNNTTVTARTNASSGYTLYAAVDSSSATDFSDLAGASADMSSGSNNPAAQDKFGLYVQKASGDGTVNADYDSADASAASSNSSADTIASNVAGPAQAEYQVGYAALAYNAEAGAKSFVVTYTITADF